jgi:hypothetical protein
MAKGNHVFNDFDGCVATSFKTLARELSLEQALIAATSSGGENSPDAATIRGHFPSSYATLAEMRTHDRVKEMHWIQDDNEVIANDGNSMAFGRESNRFSQAVVDWAWGRDDKENPMTVWRDLVNAGEDLTARKNFAKGSSRKEAPRTEAGREELCQQVRMFIRGELSKLVGKWLIQLRNDMARARPLVNGVKPVQVDYDGKRTAWLERLQSAGGIPITD